MIGLQLVFDRGFRYVKVCIDSSQSSRVSSKKASVNANGWRSVHKICHLLERDWEFTISHVYLEENMCAELANHGCCGNNDLIMYDHCPNQIRKSYIDDA